MADSNFLRFKYDTETGNLILSGWNGAEVPAQQVSDNQATFMHQQADALGVTFEAYCRFCSGMTGSDVDAVKLAIANQH